MSGPMPVCRSRLIPCVTSLVLAACGARPGASTGSPAAPVAATPEATGASAASSGQSTVEQLVRLRCALDGRDVVTSWRGSVYAFVPGERPRRLFAVVGMNIARCVRVAERWHLTSRELMYYLDPETGNVLDRWTNPWTQERVPVVHVANRLVQHELGPVSFTSAGGRVSVVLDIPVFYPNPLAQRADTRELSPAEHYQAGEFFAFETDAAAFADRATPTVPALSIVWHRVGPWLPWMSMGTRPGYLVYSAHGRKLHGLDELPAPVRDDIDARLPLYREAPRCLVDARNDTSWTYFARHVAEYRAGAKFPIAAPVDPDECRVPAAPSTGRR